MKRLCISLLLIAAADFSRAQYAGSSNDGFSDSAVNNQKPLSSICRDGINNYVKIYVTQTGAKKIRCLVNEKIRFT